MSFFYNYSMVVRLGPKADKQYKRLNEPILGRIKKAIDDLEFEPPKGDIIPLTGTRDYFRLYIGGLRLLFKIVDNEILVTDIEPRGQAYSKKIMKGKK